SQAPPPDERRRSKRDSTASATRRREDASRYPSPPPGGSSRSRPTSIDASLTIPPYNPSNRRPVPSPTPSQGSSQSNATTTPDAYERFDQLQPSSRIPAPIHQTQHRPASAQVIPVTAPLSPTNSAATAQQQQRARQSVGYLPTNPSASSAGPYPNIYSPHAMPRQKIYFGPYILLQTLGEGEFGKVKLGVHSERWGEEVAIKLIKRGSVDTAQRTEKVRREIDVLKAVRHPNIVRLYDVIETEKYIGIVLEYASGGELFDHILAHRYLKERDASRLFAQLISGVAYLHAKKIVHRDLKLENLLLDRNRNVIITDFGFANRFELAADDLMATSCGSPCYAAPELVVQEGKYVGTAVDVWSCGVILYAMLAGYLPYDDDPANPEGDNINLLYKYIINTPLSFPDWISAEPRDLLLRMLVPDPLLRCTVEDVMRHDFLRKYQSTFQKSVADLEAQAQEAELFKRQALEAQRQFLIQQQIQQKHLAASGMSQSQAQAMGRSQSQQNSIAMKHRSAAVPGTTSRHMMESSNLPTMVIEESSSSRERQASAGGAGGGVPGYAASRRQNAPPTTQTYPVSVDADPFSYESRPTPLPTSTSVPMIPSFSAPPSAPSASVDQIMAEGERRGESRRRQDEEPVVIPTTSRSRRSSTKHPSGGSSGSGSAALLEAERRKKASHRATVQVEYDGGDTRTKVKPKSALGNAVTELQEKEVQEDVEMTPVEEVKSVEVATPTSPHGGRENSVEAGLAAMALTSPGPPSLPTFSPEQLPARVPTPPLVSAVPFPATPPQGSTSPTGLNTPKKRKNTGSPTDAAKAAAAAELAVPKLPVDHDATPRAKKISNPVPEPTLSPEPAVHAVAASPRPSIEPPRPPSVASTVSATRHKKGPLSTDRFSFRGLLSGSSTSLERTPSATGAKEKAAADAKAAEAKRVADQKALDEVTNNRRKSRRQKALSMGGFSRPPAASKLAKSPKVEASMSPPPPPQNARTRSSTVIQNANTVGSMGPPPRPTTATAAPPTRQPAVSITTRPFPPSRYDTGRSEMDSTWGSAHTSGGTPSGKAKQVMDWFRRKGPKGDSGAVPFQTDFDRHRRPSTATNASASLPPPVASTSNVTREEPTIPAVLSPVQPAVVEQPSVVVTGSEPMVASVPSSRSASGAQSDFSHATVSSLATTVSTTTPSTPVPFTESKLRFHVGALDKSALTQRPPAVVITEIRNALWCMGIDMIQEGEYKLKCVRKSRKKLQAIAGLGLSSSLSSTSISHSASPLDRRSGMPGSPSMSTLTASPSSGFRSFFGRKVSGSTIEAPSVQSSPGMGMPSPALSAHEGFDLLASPVPGGSSSSQGFTSTQPLPAYGDSNDAGGEVRFYCEITRVTGLAGMYCIDMRRVKGELFSYRFVYTTLLSQLSL
ncbi:hypothetical protein P7C70_g6692, partial [Phenoliferia sp. Uapishka_3]